MIKKIGIFIKIVIATWYRYYSKGSTAIIAYESAIVAFVFLLIINFFTIINIFFDIAPFTPFIPAKAAYDNKLYGYFWVLLYFIPFYLLFAFLFKKKEIEKVNLSEAKYKRNGYLLISYVLFSMFCFILAAIY